MKRLLLLHGPNLNALGRRDPEHYGRLTLAELVRRVEGWARERGVALHAWQSNHEGALIDELQRAWSWADGALVNLGAYTHTSYALRDALADFGRPVVEVHLSALSEREPWRRTSVIRDVVVASFEGRGVEGYRLALERLLEELLPEGD
jgi:3-dehydroquinate dehydratase-2